MAMNLLNKIIVIMALLSFVQLASANGYGTSSISLSQSATTIAPGGSQNINYTVNLASGNTWGTTLQVVDNSQLASKGIMVSISNPSGDPPYSGYLTISPSSSTAPGTYSIVLQATGDDPSSNQTLTLNVASIVTNVNSTTSASTSTPHSSTTTPYSTTGYGSGTTPVYSTGSYSTNQLAFYAVAILSFLIAAYFTMRMKSMGVRAVIWGMFLLIVGTAAWIYGDFSGGNFTYINAGVGASVLGLIIWIVGNAIGGAFHNMKNAMLDIIGIILVIIGIAVWAYADYVSFSMTALWGGIGALLLGILIWFIGDWKAGAFMMSKR